MMKLKKKSYNSKKKTTKIINYQKIINPKIKKISIKQKMRRELIGAMKTIAAQGMNMKQFKKLVILMKNIIDIYLLKYIIN